MGENSVEKDKRGETRVGDDSPLTAGETDAAAAIITKNPPLHS